MSELILHHFDASPFAEKVRLTMGLKGLTWRAVDIPMILPKPDLMPLTGGYRRTPVLQIGADIYCDSRLIMLELERRFPNPTLFPHGGAGLMTALASWSDSTFFEPGAGLSMGLNQGLPEDLLNDRKDFFNFMNFETLANSVPELYGQFLAQLQLLETELAGGAAFLSGEQVAGIDILGYFPVWMARGNFPQVNEWMAMFPNLLEWESQMQELGHGEMAPMSAEHALDAAQQSDPEPIAAVASNPEGLALGELVEVSPRDYGVVPVAGILQALTLERITIRRDHDLLGAVHNHFPRSGFAVTAQ